MERPCKYRAQLYTVPVIPCVLRSVMTVTNNDGHFWICRANHRAVPCVSKLTTRRR